MVEPTVTSSFSVALFKAVIGDGVNSVPLTSTLPKDPVDVAEPLMFPSAVILPPIVTLPPLSVSYTHLRAHET